MRREKSLLRESDERATSVVTRFLENFFYNTMTTDYKYHTDVRIQCQGIDTTFIFNGRKYYCDEKAAVRYMNRELSTFSMELSFIDRGNHLCDGWLVDEGKANDSFIFVWLDEVDATDPSRLGFISQLKRVEFALVDREAIVQYLTNLGWTREKLKKKADRLRRHANEPVGNLCVDGCRFTVSKRLVEQPVNVLLTRDVLIGLSDYHTVIRR